ncbi:MAG: methylmalonyl-CoA mutase [Dehalococcoidia bacterium]
MFDQDRLEEIERRRRQWEERTLKPSLERFGVEESPQRFYTPLDIEDHDFLEKVGFPGEYPFAAGIYATPMPALSILGAAPTELVRAGMYSGYGTAEDTRDYYNYMRERGRPGGPNIAFDLPTQCGYDSDDPMACGEVGKVGVAVDTLRDMEVIYEAFVGDHDLDRSASNFTINAPCNIILAMYFALAQRRGIPLYKLRGTPQNDILKEYVARGTYIFPPKPSMRLIRDTITHCTEHAKLMNTISICGYHMREAGATGPQVLAFTFSNAIAYVQVGIDAGLDVDTFVPRFTFLNFGGGMELFKEIALQRAARRMWARIMRDRFGSENPRCWILRQPAAAATGEVSKTVQRPLNNFIRSVVGGVASCLSGGGPFTGFPYDEPLGLGHSREGWQLNIDAMRILLHEAELCEVSDPLAGSYYVESLTDQIEEEAWREMERIEAIGGAVAAIEKGYMQQEIAKSAYRFQREVESRERVIVGVNRFLGEHELEVATTRLVEHPYDPVRRAEAEEKQIANLARVKRERDNEKVKACLKRLEEAARDESLNTIPPILEAVKTYATLGEMCRVLRDVFGEYQAYNAVA